MRLLVFFPLAMVLVAGCIGQTSAPSGSGQPLEAPTTRAIEMTIGHGFYDPNTITVNQGDIVRIKALTAPGTETHNHGVTIDEYGINKAVTSSTEPVEISIAADKPGTFTGYCGTCKDGIFGAGHPAQTFQLVVRAR